MIRTALNLLGGLAAAGLATAALAQTPAPAASATAAPVGAAPAATAAPGMAPPPPGAPPMTPQTDLIGISCGEFLATLAVANPGTNPTSDRQSQATRAQRDAYMYIIWANGYVTGKDRQDLKKAGLTRDWIVANTTKMANACKANPNMSIFEAVGKL